jgi:hypothetical protein
MLFLSVISLLLSTAQGFAGVQAPTIVSIMSAGSEKAKVYRDYSKRVTEAEKKLVSFIILTMGNGSLRSIWSERSALERAGDQIDHLHPLRFLMTIFSDEKMKAAMGNIHGRSFVWGRFKKGLFVSLDEESDKDNISLESIRDFAKTIGVDHNLLLRPLKQKKWDEFIHLLIKHVPRAGDPQRYDM